jgi:hypothetical protein
MNLFPNDTVEMYSGGVISKAEWHKSFRTAVLGCAVYSMPPDTKDHKTFFAYWIEGTNDLAGSLDNPDFVKPDEIKFVSPAFSGLFRAD